MEGHGRSEALISQPRAVSALMQKDCTVRHVACSEAATVVATSHGDVFALYQYQCRKIVSKYGFYDCYCITVVNFVVFFVCKTSLLSQISNLLTFRILFMVKEACHYCPARELL